MDPLPQHAALERPPWPRFPYKGFSFYGPKDVPLFAGREEHVKAFARLVLEDSTRFVLLQGATGCGKSSFLRAGLIPFLEGRQRGYEFRKEGPFQKAVFTRSTEKPLQRLAGEIFKLASQDYVFPSPEGEEHVCLKEALHGKNTIEDFARLVIGEPDRLVESLGSIAKVLPVMMILVVDQGEEVLSLGGGQKTDAEQDSYFRFLALFGESKFPLKLIIALRSDYFGDFLDAINEKSDETVTIPYFRLKNLGRSELIRAIKRPTQTEAVPGYGAPDYGFEFEDQLPEQIVDDLKDTAARGGLVGGELPVLQVVCETLYRKTQSRGKPWKITFADYALLGKVETQLNDYVDDVLISFCTEIMVAANKHAKAIVAWKDALTELALVQANNSITTAIRTLDQLEYALAKGGADSPDANRFGELLKYLAEDDQGVLRRERIRKLDQKVETAGYSLRHDAVGLVLVRWKDARRAGHGVQRGLRVIISVISWMYLVMGVVSGIGLFWNGARGVELLVPFGCGVAAFLFFLGLWRSRGSGRELRSYFGWQLITATNPVYRVLLGRRALDREGLIDLEQNPVFRLYLHTTPSFERLLNDARQRLGTGSRVERAARPSPEA
jgi:hypothetical protein